MEPKTPPHRPSWLRVLLILPFLVTLWVPFYNQTGPALFGFPFFYWFQMAAVIATAVIIFIVFKAED